jgi:ribosomal protein L11 methyltransferase
VVDVGTGSGVLAIAAAKLGAAHVTAIDNDSDAIANARENAERNDVHRIVDVRKADVKALDTPPADVVLANLTAAVLQRAAADLQRLTARGGALIVSGFGPDELKAVSGAVNAQVVREAREGDWAAARLRI